MTGTSTLAIFVGVLGFGNRSSLPLGCANKLATWVIEKWYQSQFVMAASVIAAFSLTTAA